MLRRDHTLTVFLLWPAGSKTQCIVALVNINIAVFLLLMLRNSPMAVLASDVRQLSSGGTAVRGSPRGSLRTATTVT